jgi:hypothetical protein
MGRISITGSLRRTRQSTRIALPRVAAKLPTSGSFSAVTAPNFDTVPAALFAFPDIKSDPVAGTNYLDCVER